MNLRMLWFDGRIGHTTYLMFFLTFVNFIIIAFNFLIEGNSIFEKIIPYMWLFSIIFVLLYVPISILIGRWHKNTQLSTEMDILVNTNPILARMVRTLLDVQTGRASKEEIEEFRKMIVDIEKDETR